MEYVRLGKNRMKVSRLCLGRMSFGQPGEHNPWVLDEEESRPYIQRALEAGINFFDTADVYSIWNERDHSGECLAGFRKRDEVVMATKVRLSMGAAPNHSGLSRKHVRSAIDTSLKRLDTDYVDLHQIHRCDYETPIKETMEALHDIVRTRKPKEAQKATLRY